MTLTDAGDGIQVHFPEDDAPAGRGGATVLD